jgi:hypothetical protein
MMSEAERRSLLTKLRAMRKFSLAECLESVERPPQSLLNQCRVAAGPRLAGPGWTR